MRVHVLVEKSCLLLSVWKQGLYKRVCVPNSRENTLYNAISPPLPNLRSGVFGCHALCACRCELLGGHKRVGLTRQAVVLSVSLCSTVARRNQPAGAAWRRRRRKRFRGVHACEASMSRERAAKAMLRGTCWLQRCVSALNTCETVWRDQNTVVLYSGALCALSEVEHLLPGGSGRARTMLVSRVRM